MLTRFRSFPGFLFKPVQHPELLSYPAALTVFLLLHLIVYKCTSALSSLPPPTFISLWRQKLLHPTLYPSNCPRRHITLSAEATLLWDAGHSRDDQERLTMRCQYEEPSITIVWPALIFQRRKRLLALHRKSKVRIPKDLSAICFERPRKIMCLCHRSDVQI